MPVTTPIEYTCAACGESFLSRWCEAEAIAEFQREFPGGRPAKLVCDTCYAVIMAYRAQWINPN